MVVENKSSSKINYLYETSLNTTFLNQEHIKLLFGLKIKQLRTEKGFSLNQVAEITNISMSYLNEIEKGKKYPKSDKILKLAKAFNIEYDELVSLKLNVNLQPFANFLNSNFLKDFPLEFFGINPVELVGLMSGKPNKLGAFVNTLLEIGRSYNVSVEDFYFAVLRSFQEMNFNYFPEIEKEIETFLEHETNGQALNESFFVDYLKSKFGVVVDYFDEKKFPKLKTLRSVYFKKKKLLLINKSISREQRTFTLGREIGFNYQNLEKRPYTSSWIKPESFEHVFNNFKASYFSVGLIVNKGLLATRITDFFNKKTFNIGDLVKISKEFNCTAETFFHQFSRILINNFGVKDLFFLRFENNPESETYFLTKEMHLSHQYAPTGNVNEHYCRRWKSIDILKEFKESDLEVLDGIQISNFFDTENRYIMFSMARRLNLTKNQNISISIGIKITPEIEERIKFLNDDAISRKIINRTCERCAIFDCKERVASPRILQKTRQAKELETEIDRLLR